jgi:23S rRNA pseudouridine1911/1915/1917 synthase
MLPYDIQIIHEDDNLLVINKPYGLIVNRSETSVTNNLQTLLMDYLDIPLPSAENDSDFYDRCGIVHRLDKDTSGVLLIAKTKDLFEDLQAQFKQRLVKKEYMAVTHDRLPDEKMLVNAPIKRDVKNRLKYAVAPDGKEAITQVERVSEWMVGESWVTLVKVQPLTGRTHQIRVHLCALGNPVIGDKIYTSLKRLRWAVDYGIERMLLHAYSIEFTYMGKSVTFETELPAEFDENNYETI